MPRKNFAPYEAAMAAAKAHAIKRRAHWRDLARTPEGRLLRLPVNPEVVYREFSTWTKFLGSTVRLTLAKAEGQRPFAEARELARSMGFRSSEEYRAWANSPECPDDVPRDPPRTYASKGWVGWPDFLGCNPETGSEREFASFETVQAWAQAHDVRNNGHWRELVERQELPPDFPSHPERTYQEQWPGWELFLGPAYEARRWLDGWSYAEACAWAQENGVRNSTDWRSRQLPDGAPRHPDRAYAGDGWKGWPSFLGRDESKTRLLVVMPPFEELRAWARKQHVGSVAAWRRLYKAGSLPKGAPLHPDKSYRASWKGYRDFFGKELR